MLDVNGQAGKGDTYRPVDQKTWAKNYEAIFGRRKPRPKTARIKKKPHK